MDYTLFRAINNLAGQNPLLDNIGIFFAAHAIIILAAMILISPHRHKLTFWLQAGSAAVVTWLINQLIGAVWFIYRPFAQHENVHKLIEKAATEKSFPSDHAGVSFALATIIFLFNKKLGYIAYILAILIALSRVYVGVHFPKDILTGAIIGILIAYAIHKIADHFTQSKK